MPGTQVHVDASALFDTAARYRAAGQHGLVRQLDRGSREAGQVIADEIAASTDTYIPRGFQERFRQNLDLRTQVRLARERRITVLVGARGKAGHRRHVKEMNEGKLRAPVHGRRRRLTAGGKYVPAAHQSRIEGDYYVNPWRTHRIRPGLADEPAARVMPQAKQKISDAMARTAAKLGKAG